MTMIERPQISFVVPAYNSRRTVAGCIDSILSQKTGSPFEVIVVDNNSRDESSSIAKEKGVRVVDQPVQGAAAARNKGLEVARGKYVAFIDSDVILDPGWANACLEHLQLPWIDCVQTGIYPVESDGSSEFMNRFRKRFISQKTEGSFSYLPRAATELPVLNSSAFMAKGFVLKRLRFDQDLLRCEDADFGYQLLFSGCNFALSGQLLAHVKDDRNIVQYLHRSFENGRWTNQLRRGWAGSTKPPIGQYVKDFFQKWKTHDLEQSFVRANLLTSMTGDVYEWIRDRQKTNPDKIERNLKADTRTKYFLYDDGFELNPYTRFLWLADRMLMLNLVSGSRKILSVRSSDLLVQLLLKCCQNGETRTEHERELINELRSEGFMTEGTLA